ncbi:MAG TPA: ABC transporter ATP-binding protein [Pseudolabrys sp.]|nr:ABC transporter ATP-binding protein [Pseudolabrys sp.]
MTAARPLSISSASLALAADAFGVLGWRLPLLAALTLASAALEGLTLAMLLPLLAVLGFGRAGADPVSRTVIALFDTVGMPFTALSIALLLLGLLAASAAVFLLQAYFSTRLQAAYVADWQRRLFGAVVRAGWPFLRRQRAGEIIAAMTMEAQRLGGAFYQANLIATSTAFLAVQVAIAAAIAPAITAGIGLVAALLFAATRRLVRRALAHGAALTAANSDLQANTGELVANMKLVKATAREDAARALVERAVDRIERLSFRNAFDVQIVRAIFEYASGAAVALLLIAGPLFLGVEIGVVVLIVAMFVRLFPKVTGLRQCIQSLGLALPAFDALRAMLAAAQAAREEVGKAAAQPARGPAALSFAGVSVRGDAGECLLREVDVDIPAGALAVVVGATGAGKTTLVDCALGLVEPSAGRVLIDGVALTATARAAFRRTVGYIGQEAVLFSGTLRENVAWGRPLEDDAIRAALRQAGAAFALAFEGGLDAVIAERGGSLSGGERQRIALARALAGTPRLLVLDEPTSALDPETENEFAAAIRARRGAVTILAVTHRLRIAAEADLVVVLDAGGVAEAGPPAQLLARGGRFAALWRAQNGAVAEAATEPAR